jgi:hypothetical protein
MRRFVTRVTERKGRLPYSILAESECSGEA